MDVDSTMATQPELKLATTTENFSSGESSSTPATPRPLPFGLTPLAMKALGEEGSQVLLCSGSRRLLFRGSKELQGNWPVPLPAAESDDIFADYDPNYHMLILQEGQKAFCQLRPTQSTAEFFKNRIAVHAACSSRQGIKRIRNQQLPAKEGSSGKQPHRKPLQPSLIVIKKVASDIELQIMHPSSKPKLATKKQKGSPLGVIFTEWKLSTAMLPALPLVPSLSSHLPWFYIASPATSEGNHIFGNMATQQSMLVANSDLQSSPRLLHSKDGWLLFQGRRAECGLEEEYGSLPVFLLNPTTGARIDLPGVRFRGGIAAFRTTAEGTPEVVIFVRTILRTVTVHMVRPGSACWEEHPYEFSDGPPGSMQKMVLCGSYVYCFFNSHRLIFKLTDLSWHPITLECPYPNFLLGAALEIEGKVVIVNYPEYFNSNGSACNPIRFFKMEMSGDNFEWVEIAGNNEELDGRILFIDRLQSFSVKVAGSGQKMCWFERNPLTEQGMTQCALHCLNLTTRAHRMLIADSVFCRQRAWVDLGGLSDRGLVDSGITGDELLPGC